MIPGALIYTEVLDRSAAALADSVLPSAAPRWEALSETQRNGYRALAKAALSPLFGGLADVVSNEAASTVQLSPPHVLPVAGDEAPAVSTTSQIPEHDTGFKGLFATKAERRRLPSLAFWALRLDGTDFCIRHGLLPG